MSFVVVNTKFLSFFEIYSSSKIIFKVGKYYAVSYLTVIGKYFEDFCKRQKESPNTEINFCSYCKKKKNKKS